jgi:hypothetical protein
VLDAAYINKLRSKLGCLGLAVMELELEPRASKTSEKDDLDKCVVTNS